MLGRACHAHDSSSKWPGARQPARRTPQAFSHSLDWALRLAMILTLPAAIGLGAGSDTNGPLSIAVIGGLVSSTLLTLVVVPSLYSLVEHRLARTDRSPA